MLRNIHQWLPAYFKSGREPADPNQPLHLYFCFVDHFEPLWNGVDEKRGLERVRRWVEEYPMIADQFRDYDGRPVQHSFFFPAEEYRPAFLDRLQELCRAGYGD